MTLVSRAVEFAAKCHDGAVRKGTTIPYIVHPMEAAAIAASVTDDQEILAAALLHDVIEDCGISEETLCDKFGPRVAQIVAAESEEKDDRPHESWNRRKQATVDRLSCSGRAEKIVALADKLSNMRAIRRDYDQHGEAVFFRFHQHDKSRHAWYYRSCAALMKDELGDTAAHRELVGLIGYVFSDIPEDREKDAQAV